MKRTPFSALAIGLCLAIGLSVGAQAQQLKVATGGATGTYSAMLKQASQLCGTSIALTEQNTSGSMENINLLVGNQVNAAFVQTDVLYFRARTEDLGGVKTLVALHPEEVHVLALAESLIKEGGVVGIGAKPIQLATVKDLAGRRVGAVGGSAITAQVIRLQAEIGFNVVEFPDNKALINGLQSGAADAGVLVGGAPLGAISELKGGWKLLPFPEDVVNRLKSVYRPARLNYAGIGQMGVNTIATDALFVTREYKTAKFVDALGKFRGCLLAGLDELKESTGMHPKWQAVDPTNKGKWPYYELPVAVPVVKAAGK
jgi:TRAP-type uncharacterized transport system substrate-binding protein